MLFETKRSIEKNYLYTQTDENLNFIGHVHSSFEFVTVTEGSLDCIVNEDRFTIEKGQAMLIMPNHIHRYETNELSKSFLCVFSVDYVIDFYNDTKAGGYLCSVFDFKDNGEIELLKQLAPDKYLTRSVLYKIVGSALKNLYKNTRGGDATPSRSKRASYPTFRKTTIMKSASKKWRTNSAITIPICPTCSIRCSVAVFPSS